MTVVGFIKTSLFWIVSIAVGIFSILIFFGLYAEWKGMSDGPSLPGAGLQDNEEKIPAGPSYEIPTLNQFISAAMSGVMPGGSRTELPVFPKSDMKYFSTPFTEWAPPPFDKLPGPPGPFGMGTTSVSPPPIIRIMHVLSGLEDILAMAFSQKLPLTLEPSFKATKTKVWLGIAPVSEARWRAKGLDAIENIEEALAIIQQVIDVWIHLAKPEIQGDLRHINNKVWAEIDVFQDGCNAVRTSKGEPVPAHSLTKLWEVFQEHHFKHMEHQSRAWLLTHLKILHNIWKDRFLATFQSGRELSSTQATVKIDHYDLMIMNKIQDMQFAADIYVRPRPDGFVTASRAIHPQLANIEAPKEQLNGVYKGIEQARVAAMNGAFQQVVADRMRVRREEAPVPSFMESTALQSDREWAHKTLQTEIENPPEIGMESWVRAQMDEKVEKFGFVIYRLAYEKKDRTWDRFVKNLEMGLNSGLDSLVGADGIKKKATLHWIDGREEKIPEGDVDAARKHFNSFSEFPTLSAGLAKTTFLAITPNSLLSFTQASANERQGDYRGFLLAVDSSFDPSATETTEANTAESSTKKENTFPKGYDGTFKIIDQLVWTDLFAVHVATGSQNLQEYWTLAARHPWGVYVGPTTGVRRRQWREMGAGMGLLLEASKNARPEGGA